MDLRAPAMKISCTMDLASERTCCTFDNERLSRGIIIWEEVARLWMLFDMTTNSLVYFEDVDADKCEWMP